MRLITTLAALALLSACDVPTNLEEAKQQAADIGGQVMDTARGAVDTRTACMLAGQSEAFCGCVQERLGPQITEEHVTAITTVARETLEGRSVEAAAESASNIDPTTRDALVQCATHAAVQGALGGEAENAN
ncbi:MAG: hypothetical protein M0D54_21420 [Hyphomonadaceae bacterium JAD_PAG50586_4]|nr:MAG: hypothetical protein M0D54_21420 [Hyphomonadaceae bacterium JAD_PAG50586_4]